jgi:hypothetical protein
MASVLDRRRLLAWASLAVTGRVAAADETKPASAKPKEPEPTLDRAERRAIGLNG